MDLPTENVQTYPRPPRLEPVPHRVRVRFADRTIVDTRGAFRVLETHHPPTYYIPPEDCDCDLLPFAGQTMCEWKGAASYFDVQRRRANRAPRRMVLQQPDTPLPRDHRISGLLCRCSDGRL